MDKENLGLNDSIEFELKDKYGNKIEIPQNKGITSQVLVAELLACRVDRKILTDTMKLLTMKCKELRLKIEAVEASHKRDMADQWKLISELTEKVGGFECKKE